MQDNSCIEMSEEMWAAQLPIGWAAMSRFDDQDEQVNHS
jgi:hypothetical protein